MRVPIKVGVLIVVFGLSCATAYAEMKTLSDFYQPFSILGPMEQMERIKQLRLQNQMMRNQIQGSPEKVYKQGFDDGYNAGMDAAINSFFQNDKKNIQKKFSLGAESSRKKHADWDKIAFDPNLPISDFMASLIQSRDMGAEIAYYLGSNPEESKKITTMSPIDAIMAIGHIEEILKEQKQ